MCGIAGVIAAGESKLVIEPKAIDAMRDRLAHRGPDDAMTWRGAHAAIGFRRLAIRDTSEAGRQPMLTSDGRYVLAFNGEIYNDAELRRELGSDGVVFRSGCDAETLLTLLERYGVQGLQRVRGMFA
ncbi:MAG: asparagine synthetase B, partial [Planctomycetota bacterium]